jgi:hypothetical protein
MILSSLLPFSTPVFTLTDPKWPLPQAIIASIGEFFRADNRRLTPCCLTPHVSDGLHQAGQHTNQTLPGVIWFRNTI